MVVLITSGYLGFLLKFEFSKTAIIAATKINQRAFLSNDYMIYKIKVFDFR